MTTIEVVSAMVLGIAAISSAVVVLERRSKKR